MRQKLESLLLRLEAMRQMALRYADLNDHLRYERYRWEGHADGLKVALDELAEILKGETP